MTTGQIYWGAVPFVCIQVLMIGLTLAFPQMVMHYKGTTVDPKDIQITLPPMGGSGLGQPGGFGLPPLGAPAPAAPGGAAAPAPAAPAGPNLSQPPSFN